MVFIRRSRIENALYISVIVAICQKKIDKLGIVKKKTKIATSNSCLSHRNDQQRLQTRSVLFHLSIKIIGLKVSPVLLGRKQISFLFDKQVNSINGTPKYVSEQKYVSNTAALMNLKLTSYNMRSKVRLP